MVVNCELQIVLKSNNVCCLFQVIQEKDELPAARILMQSRSLGFTHHVGTLKTKLNCQIPESWSMLVSTTPMLPQEIIDQHTKPSAVLK